MGIYVIASEVGFFLATFIREVIVSQSLWLSWNSSYRVYSKLELCMKVTKHAGFAVSFIADGEAHVDRK